MDLGVVNTIHLLFRISTTEFSIPWDFRITSNQLGSIKLIQMGSKAKYFLIEMVEIIDQ